MKIGVLGAGAVGSMIGGLIKCHAVDTDVVLIARGEHAATMQCQGGVRLEGVRGVTFVPLHVSHRVEDLVGCDYVLFTVKSYSTQEAIRLAADYLGNATVISIQNGINQRLLAPHVAAERLVMGMTATNIAITKPGRVAMQRNDATVIGPASGLASGTTVARAADLLRQSGLKVVVNSNVLGAQYNKLVFNTLGAAASLSESDFLRDAVLDEAWRNTVAIPLQREAMTVLTHAGVQLSRISGAPDAYRFARLLHFLNVPVLGALAASTIRRFFNRKPIRFSLGIDLKSGKKTEVDYINGEIVQLAKQVQIHAPLNEKVVELVHQLERSEGFFSRDAVISWFRALQQ